MFNIHKPLKHAGYSKVTASLPQAVVQVLHKGSRARRLRTRYERCSVIADGVAKGASGGGPLAGMISSIVGAVACPPLVIILPAVLPITAFLAGKLEDVCTHKVQGLFACCEVCLVE